jgi:hypothetical protein
METDQFPDAASHLKERRRLLIMPQILNLLRKMLSQSYFVLRFVDVGILSVSLFFTSLTVCNNAEAKKNAEHFLWMHYD